MEKYVKPEMEVVKFDAEDVIMASGGCTTDCTCVDPTSAFDGPWLCFAD